MRREGKVTSSLSLHEKGGEGDLSSFLTSLAPLFLPRYAYLLPVLAASLGNRLKKGSTGSGEEAVNLCHTSPFRLRHRPYLSLNGDAITPVFPGKVFISCRMFHVRVGL